MYLLKKSLFFIKQNCVITANYFPSQNTVQIMSCPIISVPIKSTTLAIFFTSLFIGTPKLTCAICAPSCLRFYGPRNSLPQESDKTTFQILALQKKVDNLCRAFTWLWGWVWIKWLSLFVLLYLNMSRSVFFYLNELWPFFGQKSEGSRPMTCVRSSYVVWKFWASIKDSRLNQFDKIKIALIMLIHFIK